MKKCFIITPIGDDGSEIRRKTDGVIASVIRPVLTKSNYECEAAHEVSDTGSITRLVVKRILTDDLVVANLTGLNPNVMYELAIRHAARQPIITLAEKGTKLPFDIVDQRTIFYVDDMAGSEKLKEDFADAISSAEKQEDIDNPIVDALRDFQIERALEESKDEPAVLSKYILEELRALRNAINKSAPQTSGRTILKQHGYCIDFEGSEKKAQSFCRLLSSNLALLEEPRLRSLRQGEYSVRIFVSEAVPNSVLAELAESADISLPTLVIGGASSVPVGI